MIKLSENLDLVLYNKDIFKSNSQIRLCLESIFSAISVEKKSRDWNEVKKVRRINVEPSALLKNEYSERTRTNSKGED